MATLKQTAIDNVTSTGAIGSYTFTPTSENDALVVHINATALASKDLSFFGIGAGAWAWNGPAFMINKFTDNSMRIWLLDSTNANVYHIFDTIDDLSDISVIINPNVGIYFNGQLVEHWVGLDSVYENAINYFKNIFKTGNTTALNIGFGQGYANTAGAIYNAAVYEYADSDYPGESSNEGSDIYLNFAGLTYYDSKIKAYIEDKFATNIILTSADGSKFKLSVTNNGNLTTERIE